MFRFRPATSSSCPGAPSRPCRRSCQSSRLPSASSSRSTSSTTSGRIEMSAQYDLNLQDYLRILRRRWKIVVGCCLALGALTLLLTPRFGPVYEATARVKWSRTDSITGLFLEAFTWSPGDDLATQAQIITSRPGALEAAQRLGRIPADRKSVV